MAPPRMTSAMLSAGECRTSPAPAPPERGGSEAPESGMVAWLTGYDNSRRTSRFFFEDYPHRTVVVRSITTARRSSKQMKKPITCTSTTTSTCAPSVRPGRCSWTLTWSCTWTWTVLAIVETSNRFHQAKDFRLNTEARRGLRCAEIANDSPYTKSKSLVFPVRISEKGIAP